MTPPARKTARYALGEAAGYANITLKPVPSLAHTSEPGRTPTDLRRYERDPDWRLPPLVAKCPRLSNDRDTAEENHLEWVTRGHPLFEAVRRHTWHSPQAEGRHAELLARRERRRQELQQERSLTLQAVGRMTSVLVLPHPDREAPEVRRLRPNLETEATAMQAEYT